MSRRCAIGLESALLSESAPQGAAFLQREATKKLDRAQWAELLSQHVCSPEHMRHVNP